MRGSKLKKLRKAVAAELGRAPHGMMVVARSEKGVAFIPSEWRRLKKAYRKVDLP